MSSASWINVGLALMLWVVPSPIRRIEKRATNTPLKAVVFEHYKKHTEGGSHRPRRPKDCLDGDCLYIK